MTKTQSVQLFEERKVRTVWDDDAEKWYFSVVDVVGVLTESIDATAYWRKLKQRLKEEGNETVTNCHGLKMPAADGKMRMTDVADTEQLFRLIQSIPSPKAEPFKQWMAQVASDRLDQMQDPELSIQQAVTDYRRLGYDEKWIKGRLRSIEVRNDLTDEWHRCGVHDPKDFAFLTAILTKEWSGDPFRIQTVQGVEKGESARQYDQYRTRTEHACGSIHDGIVENAEPDGRKGIDACRPERRKNCEKRKGRTGKATRTQRHIIRQGDRLHNAERVG